MEDENIASAAEVKEEEPLSEVPPNENILPKIENETEIGKDKHQTKLQENFFFF